MTEEHVLMIVQHPDAPGSFVLMVSWKGWHVKCVDCGTDFRRFSLFRAIQSGLNHIVIHCKFKGRLT